MTGIAALRMYDLDEVRSPYAELWSAIASRLDAAPTELTWNGDLRGQWRDPDLVLGQTCGWPLVTELRDAVTVVGAFGYDIDGGSGTPMYRSVLVATGPRSLDSLAGSVAAVNGRDSLSGWVSLGVALADVGGPVPFFDHLIETGSHRASIDAVRSGAASVASIDAVSWALLGKHVPASTRGLVVVGYGPTVPTLPLITCAGDAESLRVAIEAAMADPGVAAYRAELLISGFTRLDQTDYDHLAALGPTATGVLGAG